MHRNLVLAVLCYTASTVALTQTWVVDASHPNANDTGGGTDERPFRSISAAAQLARPGDTVSVRAGVYRERIAPALGGEKDKPITYIAADRGKVVVKGSDIFTGKWEQIETPSLILRAALDPAAFSGDNPFHRGISINGNDLSAPVRPAHADDKLKEVLGELFVDGLPYKQQTTLDAVRKQERSWMVPPEGSALAVHFPATADPSKMLIEITTRDRIFAPHRRGLGHIHVKNFVFEHCANQGPFPQAGAVSVRSGHDWLIENNTIRYAATLGLDCGGEYWEGAKISDTVHADQKLIIGGHHMIRDNDICDNGLCGIAGWSCRDTQILNNRIERNNRLQFPHGRGWEEWAGIKLHNSNAEIHGNLVRDNLAHGIWIDNGYADARIDDNLVLRNRQSGIFLELGGTPGHPAYVTNNIIGGTTGKDFYAGFGVYTHDASDVIVAHNLIFENASFGVLMRTITDRKFGGKLVETSRNQIANNLFVNNKSAICLPYTNARSSGVKSEGNVFCADAPGTSNVFAVNKYQDAYKMADIAEILQRKLKDIPGEAIPDFVKWIKTPELTLKQWQVLMELDRASVLSRLTIRCNDRTLPPRLQIKLDEIVFKAPYAAVDGFSTDFQGRALAKDKRIPGPLQNLTPGDNEIILDSSAPAGVKN